MSTQSVDYQSLVSGYTMPFNYLWAFVVVGQDRNLALDLADLVYNSQIEVTIFENTSTTTTKESSTHTKFELIDQTITIGGEEIVIKVPNITTSPSSTTETTSTTTTIFADLTRANVWCVDYTQEYSYVPGNPSTQSSTDRYFDSSTNEYVNTTYETTITNSSYIKGSSNTVGKIDKNSSTPNFVTIFLETENSGAATNIVAGAETLFNALAQNTDTKGMVDITKYLLYVATEVDFGVTDYDFSVYNPNNFISTGTGVWSVLWNNSITKEEFLRLVNEYTPPDATGNGGRSYRDCYNKYFVANAENFFDIATKYNLDPRFIFSIGIHESAYGTSNIANDKGNFFGWGAYDSSPAESALEFYDMSQGIETVCQGIANNYVSETGEWYNWIKERGYDPTTVDGVGCRYATDTNWANAVKNYMTTIFGYTGTVSGSAISVANGTREEKLAYLFPNGVPTSESELSTYMTDATVAMTTRSGVKTTGTITVHRAVVADVQEVFQAAQNAGFKIYEAYGYNYREMNNGGSGRLSHHSYGIAIDINVDENYSHRGSTVYAGSFWDPARSEFSIPRGGVLYNAFIAKGWKWGGDWSGNYQDYMHFSFTGN